MAATALSRARRSAARRRNPLQLLKNLFSPVATTYLLMIIPAIVIFTLFIMLPRDPGQFCRA